MPYQDMLEATSSAYEGDTSLPRSLNYSLDLVGAVVWCAWSDEQSVARICHERIVDVGGQNGVDDHVSVL